jgi:hypothetical protein
MKCFFTVALGLLLLSCGGGSSSGIPQADACNQASQSACAKLFSCSDVILMIAQGVLGGTEVSCRMMIQQNYCAPFQCQAGQTYHPDKAQQCKDEFSAVTCATLAAAALAGGGSPATVLASVPGCTQVCTSGDAGSTGG